MSSNLMNNITYVDFANTHSIQIKQGDVSPILIKLGDTQVKSLKELRELEVKEEMATVYLTDKNNEVIFKDNFKVKLGTVALVINRVLPVGLYHLEVVHKGKKYPSNNGFSILINPSAEIAPESLKDLETIGVIEQNLIKHVTPKVESKIVEYLSQEVEDYLEKHKEELKGEKGDNATPLTVSNNRILEDGNVQVSFSDGTVITIPKDKDGTQGQRGEDGTSIQIESVEEQDDGAQLITFTDGKSFFVPKGEKGDPLTIKNTLTQEDRTTVLFSDGNTLDIPIVKDGKDGASAYEIASKYGEFESEEEWLKTLVGKEGKRGQRGEQGLTGDKGKDAEPLKIKEVDSTSDEDNVKVIFSDDTTISIPKGKNGANGERGERGIKGENGKDGSVVTIDEETGFWKIDGVPTNVKARVESLSELPVDSVTGLEAKLQQLKSDAEDKINAIKSTEIAELNRKVDGISPQIKRENKEYVDQKITDLIDNAPENLNTLNEIASELQKNQNLGTSLVQQISSKASSEEVQQGLAEKASKTHKHELADVNGLNEQIQEVKNSVQQALNQDSERKLNEYKEEAESKFAPKVHNHNGTYAPVSHSHSVSEITDLEARLSQLSKGLDGKDGKPITIMSTNNDEKGNTIITFSDNTRVTIPKGDKGEQGATGKQGETGRQGEKGTDGKSISITSIAEAQVSTGGWGSWFSGGSTSKVMRITFSDGKTADIPYGIKGDAGEKGVDGKSAYDIAKENGFQGTQSAWLQSLKGKDGNNGEKGQQGEKGTSVTIQSVTPTSTGTRVAFSDGNSFEVKNGTNGNDGARGQQGEAGQSVNVWTGTQSEYSRIYNYDNNTIYLIKG